jgi:hypothetical protein
LRCLAIDERPQLAFRFSMKRFMIVAMPQLVMSIATAQQKTFRERRIGFI